MNVNLVLTLQDTTGSSPTVISMDIDLPDMGEKVLDRAEDALRTLFYTVFQCQISWTQYDDEALTHDVAFVAEHALDNDDDVPGC